MRTLPLVAVLAFSLVATASHAQALAPTVPVSPMENLMDAGPAAFPDLGFLPTAQVTQPASVPAATPLAAVGGTAVPVAPASGIASTTPATRGHRPGKHVLFDQRPVDLELATGVERIVSLPFVPVVQLPPELTGVLTIQPIENTLYVTAHEDFPRTRLFLQAIDGSATLPVDVIATKGKGPSETEDLVIHLPSATQTQAGETAQPKQTGSADLAQLTRYASQQLYSPPRLIPVSTVIRRDDVKEVSKTSSIYRGGALATNPIASWCSGELCVTALRATNRSQTPLKIEPTLFRGRWVAITAQHWRLLPAGSPSDTTAIYLVSKGRFNTAF